MALRPYAHLTRDELVAELEKTELQLRITWMYATQATLRRTQRCLLTELQRRDVRYVREGKAS